MRRGGQKGKKGRTGAPKKKAEPVDLTKKTLTSGGSVGVVKAPPRVSAAAAASAAGTDASETTAAVALQMLESVRPVQKIGTVVPALAETRVHELACCTAVRGEEYLVAADGDQVVVVRLRDAAMVLAARAPSDSSAIGALATFALAAPSSGGSSSADDACVGVVTAHTASHVLRVWELNLTRGTAEQRETVRLGGCVVTCLAVGRAHARMLAVGCSDGVTRVYDLHARYFTHLVKPAAQNHAYVHGAAFVNDDRALVITHCSDTATNDSTSTLVLYDLYKKATVRTATERHTSRIAALVVAGSLVLTSGHDNTIHVYDRASLALLCSFATFETMDSLVVLGDADAADTDTAAPLHILGASTTSGSLYLWRYTRAKSHLVEKIGEYPLPTVAGVLLAALARPDTLTVVSDDYKLLAVPLRTPDGTTYADPSNKGLEKCIAHAALTIANYDVIVDTRFLGDDHLLIVQNSEIAQVLDIKTKESVVLLGHEDIILCSSVLKIDDHTFLIATGAKDARIMVHTYDSETNQLAPVATLLGHTEALTTLLLFNYSPKGGFVQLVSTSNDTTIKMWKVMLAGEDEMGDDGAETAQCVFTTHQSHAKDVNSTQISRNGALLATGSQDRTIKLWKVQYKTEGPQAIRTATSVELQGTLQGHRRGVWDVAFSSVEQVLASCSSDGSVRIWNLATHQCIESYDVSENSLLRCRFVNNSLQVVTTDSAGILYLVRFKTKAVTQLFQQKGVESVLPPESLLAGGDGAGADASAPATEDDEDLFENKLWSLDVLNEDLIDGDQRALRIVVGGTGRVIDILEDCTREKKEEEQQAREQILLQQEQFERHVRNGEFEESVRLGLALNMKMKVYGLLTQLDHDKKELILTGLDGTQLRKILEYTEEWNTNTRSVLIAQELLEIVLRHYPMQRLLDEVYAGNKQQLLQSLTRLIPYTQSTFDHYNTLLVNSCILSYF